MTVKKPRVGISPCLLGKKVRYDGGHRHNLYITDVLGQYFGWIPVCPEVEYG
ncbi:MAG: 2-thiouracil desulfurase family protein, partial [Syntrophales bacterium]